MVTDKVLSHERMRFSTMTPKQLLTRLYRITKPEKLEGFIRTARSFGYNTLAEVAIAKRNGIQVVTNVVKDSLALSIQNDIQNKMIESKETVITQEIIYKRSIEF